MNRMSELTLRTTAVILVSHAQDMVDNAMEEHDRAFDKLNESISFGRLIVETQEFMEHSQPRNLALERDFMNRGVQLMNAATATFERARSRYGECLGFLSETLRFARVVAQLLGRRHHRRRLRAVQVFAARYHTHGNE